MSVVKLAGAAVAASLVLMSLAARADGREELIACQAVIDQAARSPENSGAAGSPQDDAKLQRCRQIVRDWTLRDSRMSVDEQGRALR
ncbi:MAG TPA: hypothetical protein VHM22_12780 [Bradyrhizobium sp.]|jgi:hypothetical protein|nr:hypothetical protein [Bradyrhizobium sp.]